MFISYHLILLKEILYRYFFMKTYHVNPEAGKIDIVPYDKQNIEIRGWLPHYKDMTFVES